MLEILLPLLPHRFARISNVLRLEELLRLGLLYISCGFRHNCALHRMKRRICLKTILDLLLGFLQGFSRWHAKLDTKLIVESQPGFFFNNKFTWVRSLNHVGLIIYYFNYEH